MTAKYEVVSRYGDKVVARDLTEEEAAKQALGLCRRTDLGAYIRKQRVAGTNP